MPPYVVVESCLPDTEDLTGTYPVQAQVRDDVGLDSVLLLYSIDGGDELHLDMTDMGESVYQADIPAQEAGTTVSYTVWASDGDNTTTVPIPACSFEVRLPAPTDLSGPEGVVWGSVAQLDWQAPDSTHEVVGYRIYRDDRLQLEVEQPPVEVSVITGSQSFEVSALYVSGEGARSEAFEIEAAVPAIHGLDPEAAYQGDLIRLALEGEYLLLEQGDMAIELGPDIRVDEYDVRDVDAAFVTVQVGGHADSGVRDLLLTTGGEEVSLAGAFEVLPGSDRPTLLGVEPTSLRQGDEGALTITASEPFAGEPTVWLGGDILVEATEWSQGEIVMVDVLVPYDTPLGLHSLEVDDGTRIYTGLNLQVRDYLEPVNPDGCCSANPRGARGWLSLLLVPLVVLRRRSRGN